MRLLSGGKKVFGLVLTFKLTVKLTVEADNGNVKYTAKWGRGTVYLMFTRAKLMLRFILCWSAKRNSPVFHSSLQRDVCCLCCHIDGPPKQTTDVPSNVSSPVYSGAAEVKDVACTVIKDKRA